MVLSPYDRPTIEAKPRRKWRRRLFLIGLAVVVLGGGAALLSYLEGHSSLGKAIAEADALDPNWQIADIEAHRIRVPDAENSALQIMAADKLVVRIQGQQLYKLEEDLEELRKNPAHRLNVSEIASLKALLAQYPTAMPEYRKLATMPRGRFPINYSPDFISTLLKCQSSRSAAHALMFDVHDTIESGDVAGSATGLLASLNAARSVGDEPFLISLLVRIACDAITLNGFQRFLAQLETDEPTLAKLQAALENEEQEPVMLVGARGERAFSFASLQYFKTNPSKANQIMGAGPAGSSPVAWMFYVPGAVNVQQAATLRYMNQYVEICRRPPEELMPAIASWERESKTMPPLTRLLAPAVVKVTEAFLRNRAQLRCMIAALAAERYRLRTGKWPATLDELVTAGFLSAVPTDPFDGQRLRWTQFAEGRVIYSVGKDKVDNLGAVHPDMINKDGGDIGYRVFDVDKRRQPPLPPKPKATEDGEPQPGQPS